MHTPRSISKRLAWLLLVHLLAGTAAAQEMAVPVESQLPLMLKILVYDHALPDRSGPELTIGVAYQPRFRPSLAARDAVMAVTHIVAPPARLLPVRYVPIEVEDADALARHIEHHALDVLYVTPLRAVSTEGIARVCRNRGVTTLTGVPAYVTDGLAVGIGLRSGRPEILINLGAARAEGARFSGQLLKLAHLVDAP